MTDELPPIADSGIPTPEPSRAVGTSSGTFAVSFGRYTSGNLPSADAR